MELVVTQVWPERNPCCIVFAIIARAYLVWTKDFRKEPQGNIDGVWKGAKTAIPDSLPVKKWQTKCEHMDMFQTFSDAINGGENAQVKT